MSSAVAKTSEVIERTLNKSGAFRKIEERLYVIKQGSTYVIISIIEPRREGDRPLVRVYAQVVSGVQPEPSLFRQLLVLNGRMRFGAWAYVPEGHLVLFVHTILGGGEMDDKELLATVRDVALVADGYDDRIVARYGGQRMQDVVEEAAFSHFLGDTGDHQELWDDKEHAKS